MIDSLKTTFHVLHRSACSCGTCMYVLHTSPGHTVLSYEILVSELSDFSESTTCAAFSYSLHQTPEVVACDSGIVTIGRHVRIQAAGTNPRLVLCELKVHSMTRECNINIILQIVESLFYGDSNF